MDRGWGAHSPNPLSRLDLGLTGPPESEEREVRRWGYAFSTG